MSLRWFARLLGLESVHAKARPVRRRLRLEPLEDRVTPVSSVTDLTAGISAADLVQGLIGSGVQAANIVYTGASAAAGRFTGGANSIGFDQGVILSSGRGVSVIGNNNNTNGGVLNNITGVSATPGDSQLGAIVNLPTFDAAILEFDFVPASGILNFQYVFASEEYPEYVQASVNDVFAFFLNGQNVALLPNSTTPVSIDTVNAGFQSIPPSNSQFFVNNYGSQTPTRQITMDGLTVVLTISTPVNPGQVNHIKLAIADAGDSILDSNVFIKAGSFSSPTAPVMKVYNPLRFIFNKKTKTYDGRFTIINIGTEAQVAPLYILFKKLPKGASIANVSGFTKSGVPYVRVDQQADIGIPLRVLVKFKNPLKKPFNSYLLTKNIEFASSVA